MSQSLLLCDVEVEGRRTDVRIGDGRILEIGSGLSSRCDTLDGKGGALIPGLIDHHIHLLATAAARASINLEHAPSPQAVDAALRQAALALAPGQWLRATGFHEHRGGSLDRARLDRLVPNHPVRVQHQTGSTWFLNSRALDWFEDTDFSDFDRVDGRLEREDAGLRARIGGTVPDLAPIGRELASAGVTGVSDASVTNDASSAALIARAQSSGDLPQRAMMMSGGALPLPPSDRLWVGPVKILLDDHDLPELETLTAKIAEARAQHRRVAVHCVAAGELALTLAAFQEAGSLPGDRIEHGGVIPCSSIPVIAALGLTVVTQPLFAHGRGDRYLAEVDPDEVDDLYRCASLHEGGVRVAGSSDAPYGAFDPWAAMRAAIARRTASGRPIGTSEAVSARSALNLYLGAYDDPGGATRRVEAGAPADLCLLRLPLSEALQSPSREHVRATIVAGTPIYVAD